MPHINSKIENAIFKINAVKIYPSNPISLAKGLRKFATILNILSPFIPIFANSQITRPAGAATAIALPRTKTVLSNMDLINIFPNCGFLYGGNSNIIDDGIPFKIVLDKIFDIINVKNIPNIITTTTANVDNIDAKILLLPANAPAIKIVAIVIKNGNRPLHGTKLFVIIAINLSLGESIIRHPVTPHALHPNPMHIVRHCLP